MLLQKFTMIEKMKRVHTIKYHATTKISDVETDCEEKLLSL